jgi:cytochrome c oxidase subunit IV
MTIEPRVIEAKPRKSTDIVAYSLVWAGLLVLTGATVAIANLAMGKIAILVCLAIASLKSILVLLWFMHLGRERRLVIKLPIPIAMVALAIFIGLTFIDVIGR